MLPKKSLLTFSHINECLAFPHFIPPNVFLIIHKDLPHFARSMECEFFLPSEGKNASAPEMHPSQALDFTSFYRLRLLYQRVLAIDDDATPSIADT